LINREAIRYEVELGVIKAELNMFCIKCMMVYCTVHPRIFALDIPSPAAKAGQPVIKERDATYRMLGAERLCKTYISILYRCYSPKQGQATFLRSEQLPMAE
jgi:hypothetical protein